MTQRRNSADTPQNTRLAGWFAVCFGGFLGLALVKFGNPPIMEKWVTAPKDIYEFVLGSPWPIGWAYGLLFLLAIFGCRVATWESGLPRWLVSLPLAWLIWQCVAGLLSVDTALSKPTVAHFFACVACFYLGLFGLARAQRVTALFPGLCCAFLIVLAVGWEQHFGGLEQTRRYFFLYIYPRLKEVPPDYLKKISSTRIFATLFYPNALAGAILLLLPSMLEFIWQARARFTQAARIFLITAVGAGALGCLYWSGSKGGWLLALLLGLIWLLRLPFHPNLKKALVGLILVAGLAGFFWRYSGFFEKGATSVGARFDYWRAAVQTTLAHPLAGTGPGTFSIAYQKVKRPESEMSRLVHNDYLEQATDSGLPGFVLYLAFIGSVLVFVSPLRKGGGISAVGRNAKNPGSAAEANPTGVANEKSILFAIELGVFGWLLQGFMEFGLYIPGLAWPAFAFMGLLLGRSSVAVDRKAQCR